MVVAKVDKQHAAMVTLAVDPPRDTHVAADVGTAELAAMVGAIGVHGCVVRIRSS
jgi:hypothetical protein